MMKTVDIDDLLRFARSLDGQTLTTAARRKAFRLAVTEEGLEYLPLSTGMPRKHPRKWLARICQEFSRTNSYKPLDYQKITVNASYALVVIAQYLAPQNPNQAQDEITKEAGKHTIYKTPLTRLLDMLAGWEEYVQNEGEEYPDTLSGEQIAGLYQEAGGLMERDYPDIESEQNAVCRFVTERVMTTLIRP